MNHWVREGDGAKSNLISYYNVAVFVGFKHLQGDLTIFYECLWLFFSSFVDCCCCNYSFVADFCESDSLYSAVLRFFFARFFFFFICCFSCASLRFFYILISTTIYFALKGENRSMVWIVWRCLLLSGIIWKWRINQTFKISLNAQCHARLVVVHTTNDLQHPLTMRVFRCAACGSLAFLSSHTSFIFPWKLFSNTSSTARRVTWSIYLSLLVSVFLPLHNVRTRKQGCREGQYSSIIQWHWKSLLHHRRFPAFKFKEIWCEVKSVKGVEWNKVSSTISST